MQDVVNILGTGTSLAQRPGPAKARRATQTPAFAPSTREHSAQAVPVAAEREVQVASAAMATNGREVQVGGETVDVGVPDLPRHRPSELGLLLPGDPTSRLPPLGTLLHGEYLKDYDGLSQKKA